MQGVTRVLLWVVVVVFTLGLFGASLWLGPLNQDEGWYLYGGRLVAEGKLPFVDFATTQGPVMSVAYAAAWPLARTWGVMGGRLFTAGLGLVTAALAGVLAWRCFLLTPSPQPSPPRGEGEERPPLPLGERVGVRGKYAALLAVALIGLNLYQAYFFSIVKTYSLSALLLTAGFLALTFIEGRRGAAAAAAAGILFVLAGGVRLSAGVAVPVVPSCRMVMAATSVPSRAASLDCAPLHKADTMPAMTLSPAPTMSISPLTGTAGMCWQPVSVNSKMP